MKIIKIHGGVGNQLFQYAFAKALELKTRQRIYIDVSEYRHIKHHSGLALNNILNNLSSIKILDNRYIRFLLKGLNLVGLKRFYYVQNNFIFTDINKVIRYIYLDGYWHSFSYFQDCWDLIKSDFDFEVNLNKEQIKILKMINHVESTSIHVRRGDYLNKNNSIYEILGMDYYNKAIKEIIKRKPDAVFFIFSDDINWAKDNFKSDKKFFFVEDNDPMVDLHLIKSCKNNILANSSFSWWGAWLNSNNQKLCIAPDGWYKNLKLHPFLYPPEWVIIKLYIA